MTKPGVAEPRVAIAYDCLFPLNAGGGERVYRYLAELLVDAGCAVDYVTREQWGVGREPEATFRIEPVWHGEIYCADGTRNPVHAVRFALALFHHFRRRRGDYDLVIVSALPVLNVFAVRLALLGTQAFLVTDWLEVWAWRKWRSYSGTPVGTVAFLLQFLALWVGDAQTVNSRFTRERVRRYRAGSDPVVLGLVDLVQIENGEEVRSGAPLALFVGRHIPDKQLAALPPALAVARRSHPDLRAVIVGSGPETDAVRRGVSEHGLDAAVDFTGRIGEDELHEAFRSASVLVNPSAREGFGLVIVEAAARGTPSVVVAGEDNAAADLVQDGVNGFIAASVAPEELGAAIARAVTGGERLRRSTLDWFGQERDAGGLSASVAVLLERYSSARTR